jgi:hypothetical protein
MRCSMSTHREVLFANALFGVHPLGCPFLPSNRPNAPAVLGCYDLWGDTEQRPQYRQVVSEMRCSVSTHRQVLSEMPALFGVHPLGCPFLPSNSRNAPAVLRSYDL